jgi:hypothetical protein
MHILPVCVCAESRPPTISEAANDKDNGTQTGGKNARTGGGRGRPGKSSGIGGGGGAKGNHKPARIPKAPKTAEELDRELEAYLVNDTAGTAGGAIAPTPTLPGGGDLTAAASSAAAVEDVEMA